MPNLVEKSTDRRLAAGIFSSETSEKFGFEPVLIRSSEDHPKPNSKFGLRPDSRKLPLAQSELFSTHVLRRGWEQKHRSDQGFTSDLRHLEVGDSCRVADSQVC